MKTEFEILSANRSFCNESKAKDMAGCLADGGIVVCYFPTESAMRQASLFAAAPEMLAALEEMASMVEEMLPKVGSCQWGMIAVESARAVIAKAKA